MIRDQAMHAAHFAETIERRVRRVHETIHGAPPVAPDDGKDVSAAIPFSLRRIDAALQDAAALLTEIEDTLEIGQDVPKAATNPRSINAYSPTAWPTEQEIDRAVTATR